MLIKNLFGEISWQIINLQKFSGTAESALRQLDYDIEDSATVNYLYQLYLGELGPVKASFRNSKLKSFVDLLLPKTFIIALLGHFS